MISANSGDDSWNLKISDPGREGKFLSVPIYYGDWVPITKAKATIDSIAASIDAGNRREDKQLEPVVFEQVGFTQNSFPVIGSRRPLRGTSISSNTH